MSTSKVKVISTRRDGQIADRHSSVERALFFSRSPIGVDRDFLDRLLCSRNGTSRNDDVAPSFAQNFACRLHVGVYAFRIASLQRMVKLPPSPLEMLERLEQMRAMEAGMRIVVSHVASHAPGVDTQEDLDTLRSAHRSNSGSRQDSDR